MSRYGPLALLFLSGAVVGGLLGSQERCYHDCLRDYYLLAFGAVWVCAAVPISAWSLGRVSSLRLLAWFLSVG